MARTVDQQRQQERREGITLAAAELFARRGFAETTTAEIARAAGLSPGSVFYYFPDKRAIFRAIFERDLPVSRRLFEAHADTDDPVAAILDVVNALAADARDDLAPGLVVELLRQVDQDPELVRVVEANDAVVQEGLAALVRRAAAEGRVDRALDADEAAKWIRWIIDAVYLNAEGPSDPDPRPMLRLVVRRFLGVPGSGPATHPPGEPAGTDPGAATDAPTKEDPR